MFRAQFQAEKQTEKRAEPWADGMCRRWAAGRMSLHGQGNLRGPEMCVSG